MISALRRVYPDYLIEMLKDKKSEIVETLIKKQNDKKVVKSTVIYNLWTDNITQGTPYRVQKEVVKQPYFNKFDNFK
jgi:hypothetical protein